MLLVLHTPPPYKLAHNAPCEFLPIQYSCVSVVYVRSFFCFSYLKKKKTCSSCRELAGFKRCNKSCWFWSCSRDKFSTAIYRICLNTLVCGCLPTFCLPFQYARSWISTPVMRGYLKLNYGLHRYRAPEVLLQSPMYNSAIGESDEKKACLETSKWLWLNYDVGFFFLPSTRYVGDGCNHGWTVYSLSPFSWLKVRI